MLPDVPVLSFEHVALALAGPPPAPAVQLLKVPPGARAFLACALMERLGRAVLFVAPDDAEAEETYREASEWAGPGRVFAWPSAEVDPYEAAPPFGPAVHDRMRTLLRLASGEPAVVVASAAALAGKTIPPDAFRGCVARVAPGAELDVEAFSRSLVELGYARLPAAADPGDFALRGGILDVYSPAHPYPARVTVDFDRVAEIRWFDPETQRTRGSAQELLVVPCSQAVLRPGYVRGALESGGLTEGAEEALRQGVRFHGIEWLLPRLYGRAASLFEHLPPGTLALSADSAGCRAAVRAAWGEAEENFALAGREAGLPAPEALYLSPEETDARLGGMPLAAFDPLELPPFGRRDAVRGSMEIEGNEDIRRTTAAGASEGLLMPLAEAGKAWWKRGARFLVSSLSPSQADRMEELLSNYALPLSSGKTLAEAAAPGRGVFPVCSPLTRGFRCPELEIAVVTEAEIFG
jgi:transcription-repair coupling factor (superfamily II helicase)